MYKALLLVVPLALAGCQTTTQAPAYVMKPVEKCGYVDVPVYGILDRPASGGEIAGGAVIGGVVGNKLTNDAGGAILGALIGGSIANQRKQEQVIIDYKREWQCRTVYE